MRYVTQKGRTMSTEKQRLQTAARQQRFRERRQEARRGEQEAKGLPPLPALPPLPGSHRWTAALRSAQALGAQVSEEMQPNSGDRSEAWRESDKAESFAERQGDGEAVLNPLDDLLL